jgi:SAM-dependent methyltransferase
MIEMIIQPPLPTKVNLGGGDFSREGWLNLDVKTGYDVGERRLEDFPDECLDLVFSSHFVEHIHPEQARVLFRNIHRTLRPGGVVRITGPDLDTFTDTVLQGEEAFLAFVDTYYSREMMRCDWLSWYKFVCGNPEHFGTPNIHPPTSHCWMVSANIIAYFLICAGFHPTKVRKCSLGNSQVPELRGEDFDNRPGMSFFIEAVK